MRTRATCRDSRRAGAIVNSAAQLCLLFDEHRDVELEVGTDPRANQAMADAFVLWTFVTALARLEWQRAIGCSCYRKLWVN
jgi:hypothetical protein